MSKPVRLDPIPEYEFDSHSVFYGALSVAAICLFLAINLGGMIL